MSLGLHKEDPLPPEASRLYGSSTVSAPIVRAVNAVIAADEERHGWLRNVNAPIRSMAAGRMGDATSAMLNPNIPRPKFRPRKQTLIEHEFGRWLPPKHPRPHHPTSSASFTIPASSVQVELVRTSDGRVRYGRVRIPGARDGMAAFWLRFRLHRHMRGTDYGSVTVSLRGGQYFVSILCRFDVKAPVHRHPDKAIGVDRNVTNLCAVSEAIKLDPRVEPTQIVPSVRDHIGLPKLERRILVLEQKLARQRRARPKGEPLSARYKVTRAKLARLKARLADIRADKINKAARAIADHAGVVVLEDLGVKRMTGSAAGTTDKPGKNVAQKRGLNREFLKNAPGRLGVVIKSKVAQFGGRVVEVPAAYTSRLCPRCGDESKENRNGLVFRCVVCNHSNHADMNAAENILALGLSVSSPPGGAPGVTDERDGTPAGAAARTDTGCRSDARASGAVRDSGLVNASKAKRERKAKESTALNRCATDQVKPEVLAKRATSTQNHKVDRDLGEKS